MVLNYCIFGTEVSVFFLTACRCGWVNFVLFFPLSNTEKLNLYTNFSIVNSIVVVCSLILQETGVVDILTDILKWLTP